MLFWSYYFNHLFFIFIHSRLNKLFDHKMSNNFTALTHAIGTVFLAKRYLLNTTNLNNYYSLISYSSAYFIYDLMYIFKFWQPKTINYAYIYHHLASLYLMHENPYKYYGGHILFYGELSNIPGYLVYYYQKQKNKKSLVKKLKWAQFILYSTIRIPVMTKILTDAYYNSKEEDGSIVPLLVGTPVYIMGLIWTKKLFNKL